MNHPVYINKCVQRWWEWETIIISRDSAQSSGPHAYTNKMDFHRNSSNKIISQTFFLNIIRNSAAGNPTRQVGIYYYVRCGGVSKPLNVVVSRNGLNTL